MSADNQPAVAVAKKRIGFLDGLRGVAILMVIFFHAYARWPGIVPYGDKYHAFLFSQYGWLGVNLFFMISGFVILMTLENAGNFFQFMYRRWLRLFPAMLVASLLVFVTARLFFPERPSGIPVLRDLLPGLTFVGDEYWSKFLNSPQGVLEGAFWSLFVEVKFYIFFGTFFFLFGVNIAIACLAGLFAGYIFQLPMMDHFAARYMGWFAAGAMFYRYHQTEKRPWLLGGIGMALLSAAFLSRGTDAKLAGGVLSLFFAAVIVSSRLQAVVGSRIFMLLGFISYPLYLIHENMMISIIVKLGKWVPFIPDFLLPLIPVTLIATVAWFIAAYTEPWIRSLLHKKKTLNK